MWHSTDMGVSFHRFRDTVVAQTAAVLMNRGSSRSINAVDGGSVEALLQLVKELKENGGGEEGIGGALDDLVGAIQARRGRAGPRSGGGNGGGGGGNGTGNKRPGAERGPRMCPNCGGTHVETRCPHPEVARDKRPCWTCKGTGHSSKDCPS